MCYYTSCAFIVAMCVRCLTFNRHLADEKSMALLAESFDILGKKLDGMEDADLHSSYLDEIYQWGSQHLCMLQFLNCNELFRDSTHVLPSSGPDKDDDWKYKSRLYGDVIGGTAVLG